MTRLLAVPATISAIVVIPILVGQQRAEQPAAPNPREAALTLKLEGAEGMTQPLPLLIRASGAPPAVTTLKTADGLLTATVKPGSGCGGARPRSTAYDGVGATDWCLVLSGVPGHGEVAGVVKATAAGGSQAPPTALALTVDHRDALRWWPAIAIAAGLLGSALLTVFVNRLAASIRGNRLDQLLVLSRNAAPRNRIVGLEQWVTTRRELGDSDEALLAVVAPLVKNGPKKAREQRRLLRLALEQASLPNDHPLAVSARAEVGRETHQVSDFVDESGNPQVHPADRLRAAIGTMVAYADQLQRLEGEITNGLRKRCQPEPMHALEQAKTRWQHQSSPDSFDGLATALATAEDALYAKLSEPDCAEPEARAAGAVREDLRAAEPAPSAAVPLALGSAPAVNLLGLGMLTLLSILVALGFAAVTVYVATYDANATFGTWEDYFKLASAALAAGAAGTIAGFMAPWGASAPAADG